MVDSGGRELGFAPLWRCVVDSSTWKGTSPATKLVMMGVIMRIWHRRSRAGAAPGTCFLRVQDLALDLELGSTAVKNGISTLVERGFITARRHSHGLLVEVVNFQRWLVDGPLMDAERPDDRRSTSTPPCKQEEQEDLRLDLPEELQPPDLEQHRVAPEAPGVHQAVPTPFRLVLDRYFELYTEAYDAKPRWGGMQGKQLNELLRSHGGGEVLRRLENLFRAPPRWLHPPFTWASFHRHFDTLVEAPTGGGYMTPEQLMRRSRQLKEQGR